MTDHQTDPSQSSADGNALQGADVEVPPSDDATQKPDGLGADGTIPNHPGGVAAGHSGTASNFNPEEDEDAE